MCRAFSFAPFVHIRALCVCAPICAPLTKIQHIHCYYTTDLCIHITSSRECVRFRNFIFIFFSSIFLFYYEQIPVFNIQSQMMAHTIHFNVTMDW